MKTFIPLVALACLFLGCDKIDNPRQNYVPPVKPQRTVLIEDYTGHTCGNCPAAAEVAESQLEKYPDHVVVIAVHAGDFAAIKPKYPASYTTTTGNDWNNYFLGKNAGYPSGMVCRKNYNNNGRVTSEGKWPSLVSLALDDSYVLDLDIKPVYTASTRNLDVSVKAKFREAYTAPLLITVVITEDSIIGPQTDYRLSPADLVPSYVFNNMLRDAVNGTWATQLTTGAVAAKDSVTVSFSNYAVSDKFNDKHLNVVAFVSNTADSNHGEVLQAAKVKIKSSASSVRLR